MPRYFKETNWRYMEWKIINTVGKNGFESIMRGDPLVEKLYLKNRYDWLKLTPKIEKDLKKVKFDAENIIFGKDHFHRSNNSPSGYEYKLYPTNNPLNQILGFNILRIDNVSFTFLGFKSGGDWEIPVHFIIYYDGELRGYIPKDGNPWNTNTHQAYGNDESDDYNARKRGFENYEPDVDKMIGDIKKRFKLWRSR